MLNGSTIGRPSSAYPGASHIAEATTPGEIGGPVEETELNGYLSANRKVAQATPLVQNQVHGRSTAHGFDEHIHVGSPPVQNGISQLNGGNFGPLVTASHANDGVAFEFHPSGIFIPSSRNSNQQGPPGAFAPEWAPCARTWTAAPAQTAAGAVYTYPHRNPAAWANSADGRYFSRSLGRGLSPGHSNAIPIHGVQKLGHTASPLKQESIEPGCLTDYYDRNRVAIQLTGKLIASGQLESLLEQSPEDEHVTVWHPATGRTVAGNAAPYRRNLDAWLEKNPGWVEKSFEEKSSKRRRASRRSRAAMAAFSSLSTANDHVRDILKEVDQKVREALRERRRTGTPEEAMMVAETVPIASEASFQDSFTTTVMNYVLKDWTSDEVVRLVELIVRCSEELAHLGHGVDSDDECCDLAELAEHGSIEANLTESSLNCRKHRSRGPCSVAMPLRTCAAQREVAPGSGGGVGGGSGSGGGQLVPLDMDDIQFVPSPVRNETPCEIHPHSTDTNSAWRKIFEALPSKHPSSVILRTHILFSQVLLAAAHRGTLTNPIQSPSPTSSTSLGRTHLEHLNRALSSSHDSSYGAEQLAGFASLGLHAHSPSVSPATGLSCSAPTESNGTPRSMFRDVRVTVWDPTTGKTISGNAAPCWRNLEIWMKEHPGWCVKPEDELSASRRSKHKRARELGIPCSSSPFPASVSGFETALAEIRTRSDRLPGSRCAVAAGQADYSSMAHSLPDEHDCIEGLLMMHAGRPLGNARAEVADLRASPYGKPPLPPQPLLLTTSPDQSSTPETMHANGETA
jgi:hypothetical protein